MESVHHAHKGSTALSFSCFRQAVSLGINEHGVPDVLGSQGSSHRLPNRYLAILINQQRRTS